MPVPTLQQLIEEHDIRQVYSKVIIGGATLTKVSSITYGFSMSQVPTATVVVPGKQHLPSAVVEEASVEIWVGFRHGAAVLSKLVFGSAVVDSVGNDANEVIIECVIDGARKLSYSYNRRIDYDFTAIQAETAVLDLLALAGVANYYVELDPWVLGTAVPQTIEFSTYGEAINKIAEVDGNPWYVLPTGQVRVENRDPVPSPTARRIYFSGVLTGSVETQPVGIANTAARPRINDIQRRKFRSEVANFIHVDGAVVVSLGPNGEQNSQQITEEVDGASGQFPNGAYWIPTPPLYQDFTFSNELIDTNAKAFEVGERYFELKNRLFERMVLPVPGDPDVFLGSTVKVVDPNYSGVSSLYFVEGYRTSLDANNFTTELQLTGGPESGTTGFASPFAEFYWKYTAIHDITPGINIPGGSQNTGGADLGPGADQGAKLCEDVPSGTGSEDQGGDFISGEDKRTVMIGLDGTASQDFDGFIVSYEWTWEDDLAVVHILTGPRVTIIIDPDVQSSIEVTLEVTDNSGRTGTITKTIYTTADYLDPGGDPLDPSINDTEQGGGVGAGPCTEPEDDPPEDPDNPVPPGGQPGGGPEGTSEQPGRCEGMEINYYIAAGAYAMGSRDNRTWNDLTKAAAGVGGDIISVAAAINYRSQQSLAIFGTVSGEIIRSTDVCETGEFVFEIPGAPRIEVILFDGQEMGTPGEGEGGIASGVPEYTQGDPGVMTIGEAYLQCCAVGFTPAQAVVAVAILMAESGLDSNASNSVGNIPPSTDRGIAQINSYYHPEVSDACAYNSACAIEAMYNIADGGVDFSPWVAYTAKTYQQYLSEIQEEVGFTGDLGDEASGGNVVPARAFKIWLGTNDGRIYVSNDSGLTWELWKNFDDGYIISGIMTPSMAPGGLWVFGGDTADVNTLLRIDPEKNGNFVSVNIAGDLLAAIQTAGLGFYCNLTRNSTSCMMVFSGGVTPPIWFSNDPIQDGESWYPAITSPATINAMAPGYDGEYVVA